MRHLLDLHSCVSSGMCIGFASEEVYSDSELPCMFCESHVFMMHLVGWVVCLRVVHLAEFDISLLEL